MKATIAIDPEHILLPHGTVIIRHHEIDSQQPHTHTHQIDFKTEAEAP